MRPVIIVLQLFISLSDNYEDNLDKAITLFLQHKQIPENVLMNLVPENYQEFSLYYQTTSPNKRTKNTQFFYKTADLIFEQYTKSKNEQFYLPSIQLASFADGEYGEQFIEQLEKIVKMNPNKFCQSVKDKDYIKRNPVKFYVEQNCK